MRHLTFALLAFCCTAALAQSPNPFARPSAQLQPQPTVSMPAQNDGMAFPSDPGQGVPPGMPPTVVGGMPPPPGWAGTDPANMPSVPGMPGTLGMPTLSAEDRPVVLEVPVKRIGKVNGIAILRGDKTYMFEKDKELNFKRVPQLGDKKSPGATIQDLHQAGQPHVSHLPSAVGGPVPAIQY